MKAVCIKSYYDKQLRRNVTVGDELELAKDRFEQLSTTNNDANVILVREKTAKKADVVQKAVAKKPAIKRTVAEG